MIRARDHFSPESNDFGALGPQSKADLGDLIVPMTASER